MPRLVQVFRGHLPEQVGIADGREYIMGFHTVVTVVGTELEELRQVLVPHIQIHGHGALPHAQLVHRHRSVVHKAYPPYDTAGDPLEAPDIPSGSPDLSEIQAHPASELADLGKIVYTPVDPLQTVRDRIYETARQLVVRLARIGKSRGGHRHLELAEHIVEFPDPEHPAGLFRHG